MGNRIYYSCLGLLCAWALNAQSSRIEKMIRELKVEEKIDLLCADAPAVERVNIKKYDWWNECLHGVARNGKATVFPKPIGLGSMWDQELVYRIANAISDEARAKYNTALKKQGYTKRYEGLTYFSPTLNLARDPRWGRTSECFSEDPLLTGTIGSAFIRGLQGNDSKYLKLVATSKHFVANNEENRRSDGSAEVDEVSLREYYLPAFEQSICEGKATSVMSAYNALNGVPCTANTFLLTDILRGEWGFDGVVMSDGSAVAKIYTHHHYASNPANAAAMALHAGCDMSLRDEYREGLRLAYSQKLVNESEIDRALVRVLTLRERLGMFDKPDDVKYSRIQESVIECESHRRLALEAARRSIILLKNNEKLLPIDNKSSQKIVLIGEAFQTNYFGDYSGVPDFQSTLYNEIKNRAGNCNIEWISDMKGAVIVPSSVFYRDEKYADIGKVGLTGEYFSTSDLSGTPFMIRNDHTIHHTLNKDAGVAAKFTTVKSIRWSTNIMSDKSGNHKFTLKGRGDIVVKIDGKQIPFDYDKQQFYIDLLAGKQKPLTIEFTNIKDDFLVALLWEQPLKGSKKNIEQLAKSSDVVIVFIRDDGGAEGKDRESLNLSETNFDLIREVANANQNTVLILGSSAPLILTDIIPHTKSLINSWIAGQCEAQALAEIVFGETNPSGKTPVMFVKDEKQLPPLDSYDVHLGRSYQYFKGDVLFPFGYGLSYTSFDYSTPKTKKNTFNMSDNIEISVTISNVGDFDGEEVVECYVSNPKWQMDGLRKKLVAFKRIALSKGKSSDVSFSIPIKDLSRWDVNSSQWRVSPGRYTFHVVGSSNENNPVECFVKL